MRHLTIQPATSLMANENTVGVGDNHRRACDEGIEQTYRRFASLPADLKGQLPDPEQIAKSLEDL